MLFFLVSVQPSRKVGTELRHSVKDAMGLVRPPHIPADLVREAAVAITSNVSLEDVLQNRGAVKHLTFGNTTLAFISDRHDVSVTSIQRENARARSRSGYRAATRLSGGANAAGIVIDVGANLGDFSMYVAKLRPRMQILAVEPSPATFAYLLWNLLLNGVPILRPHEFGVAGARGGVLPMHRVVSNESMTLFSPGERLVHFRGVREDGARARRRPARALSVGEGLVGIGSPAAPSAPLSSCTRRAPARVAQGGLRGLRVPPAARDEQLRLAGPGQDALARRRAAPAHPTRVSSRRFGGRACRSGQARLFAAGACVGPPVARLRVRCGSQVG